MTGQEPIDLGHGHTLTILPFPGEPRIERYGCDLEHPRPDNGRRCVGWLVFDLPEVRAISPAPDDGVWQVESWDPITLSPSVECLVCGDHGWVRSGRWVPA